MAEKGEALLEAVKTGDEKTVRRLLAEKIDPNYIDKEYGHTSAHHAAAGGHVNCLALLRDAKVNLGVKDKTDQTPAHYAAHGGNVDCLALLRDANVSLKEKAKDGSTPLDLARREGHTAAVAFLEEHFSRPEHAAPVKTKKVVTAAPRECANCAISDIPLQSCSRCKLVAYCGKACQAQHWKQGGHKRFCVPLEQRVPPPKEPRKERSAAGGAAEVVCPICLEPLATGATSALACGHELHAECATGLRSFGVAQVCPMCREKV